VNQVAHELSCSRGSDFGLIHGRARGSNPNRPLLPGHHDRSSEVHGEARACSVP
jgi:hypothetical protein